MDSQFQQALSMELRIRNLDQDHDLQFQTSPTAVPRFQKLSSELCPISRGKYGLLMSGVQFYVLAPVDMLPRDSRL
jgi:hypothetical protein